MAQALGRVMAIVRIGGRRPTVEEIHAGAAGDLGLDAVAAVGAVRCPFLSTDGEPCQLPCGPVCGTPPPPGRPWLPRDEYLCDGGDRGIPPGSAATAASKGIDPRDAVIRFDIGLGDRVAAARPADQRGLRLRPAVRRGPRQHRHQRGHRGPGASLNRTLDKFAQAESRSHSRRLVQNQAPELARERRRAQDMDGRVFAGEDSNMRGADVYHNVQQVQDRLPEADRRDRPQPAEAGPDEGEAPARRHQDGRVGR